MAHAFSFNPAQITSAIANGAVTIHVTSGIGSEGAGAANSGFALVHKLRQAGLPTNYEGAIRFSCRGVMDPMSLAPVANELRAAGWVKATYEAFLSVGDSVFRGPLAAAAMRSVGARAFNTDVSAFPSSPSGPNDSALYAHERVHQQLGASSIPESAGSDPEEAAARNVEAMVLRL